MSKKVKTIGKIINNSKNVPFEELNKILGWFGYVRSQPNKGSSHYIYQKGDISITVPFKRPHVGVHYVKEVIRLLDLEVWYEKNSK